MKVPVDLFFMERTNEVLFLLCHSYELVVCLEGLVGFGILHFLGALELRRQVKMARHRLKRPNPVSVDNHSLF